MTPEGESAVDGLTSSRRRDGTGRSSARTARRAGGRLPALARLNLAGKLPIERMVTHRITLDEVDDALGAMRRRERARSVIVY